MDLCTMLGLKDCKIDRENEFSVKLATPKNIGHNQSLQYADEPSYKNAFEIFVPHYSINIIMNLQKYT